MSNHDAIDQFRQAALDNGVELPLSIIADGQRHRFKIDGKPNGFYKLHLDGRAAGCFQNWKLHDKPILWKHSGDYKPLTPEERKAFAIARREAEEKRLAEQVAMHHNAAVEAQRIWSAAKPAATNHPYLLKKKIGGHGARLHNGALVLPLYNADLQLMSLQFIGADGQKRFLKGGQKRGCFWFLGKPTDKVLLCEGFATGASLFEASGFQTFVCWDCGNLEPVAKIIRAKKPASEIIICGDNDFSGKGQEEAERAAYAVNAFVSIPPRIGADWNDWLTHEGGEQWAL